MRGLILDHPITVAIGLLLAAGLFRLIDIFVLRLDEAWGEIIISKIATVVLVLGFLIAAGVGLSAIGLHARALAPSVLLGLGLTTAALLAGYAAEFILQAQRGLAPAFTLSAVDPKTGLAAGGIRFALFLAAGNLVNSFAEEGLFRGVLLSLFRREFDLWPALLVSAILFGLWHVPWAVKAILKEGGGSAPMLWPLISNFLPQALLGLVWGYLYLRTGNLWGPWIAHTLTNSAVNFLHVETSAGLDTGLSARMTVFTLVMLSGLLLIHRVGQPCNLPMAEPWSG